MLDRGDIEPATVRGLKRVEYERLAELGMFEDEKVELLRGMVVTMSPEGYEHADVGNWLMRRFVRGLAEDEFEVRYASPYAANDDSEPEPDLFVGRALPQRRRAHPDAALLLVEVSNSSLRKDRGVKRALYAEVGIPEYWIVDVSRGAPVVTVFSDPDGSSYTRVETLRDGDVLRPRHVPIEIPVAEIPR